MDNELKIKVCGMRNPNNITDLVKLQPDFIGLIFYPKSKRYVHKKEAANISGLIPNGIKKVGVFVNATTTEIKDTIKLFDLDYMQLHGDESPEFISYLSTTNIPIIKAFGITDSFDFDMLSQYQNVCDYFLFDTKSSDYGGTGKKFNWTTLAQYSGTTPFFLSGGIGMEDIEEIKKMHLKNLYSIDVNSRFESEPALKNIEALKHFIEELKKNTK